MPELLKEVHEYAFSRRQCLTLKVQSGAALKFTALQREGSAAVEVAEDYGPCEDPPSLAFFVDAFEALVVHANWPRTVTPTQSGLSLRRGHLRDDES